MVGAQFKVASGKANVLDLGSLALHIIIASNTLNCVEFESLINDRSILTTH